MRALSLELLKTPLFVKIKLLGLMIAQQHFLSKDDRKKTRAQTLQITVLLQKLHTIAIFLFYFQEQNKLEIMQMMVIHSTVLKHKAALDQFRKGLGILGLLEKIQENVEQFEQFFVHSEENASPAFVKHLLDLPEKSTSEAVKRTTDMLVNFIDSASQAELLDLVSFMTGSQFRSGELKAKCITVSIETSMQGVFASCCSFELKLPASITSSAEFDIMLKSVIKGCRFTTV